MFLVKRGSHVTPNTSQTFRQFMKDGITGRDAQGNAGTLRATLNDWETHLNTLFPEARLKRILEVRGADAQSAELCCALPALWKGLLYDTRALGECEELIQDLNPLTVQRARADIATRALGAELAGKPVRRWAEQVLQVAMGGLARIADLDAQGQDERIFLHALASQVEQGETGASRLLEATRGAADFRAAVVASAKLT
jgi:glutamate--cysteine ligase